MSSNVLFTAATQAIVYNQHAIPIQKMLDYDWLINREAPSVVAIVNPNHEGFHRCFFGPDAITIPVYKTIKMAATRHQKADVFVNFASERSAYDASVEAFKTETLKTHIILAEGMPENESRELVRLARRNDGWILGPSSVGAIKAGQFIVGNAGGKIENIVESKLYRPGSVGLVAKSAGMFNELNYLISVYADGIFEGAHIGGDTYPVSSMLDNLLRLEYDPNVKMLVLLGEIGGEAEYAVVEALKNKRIKKPLVAWVSGTVASQFEGEVQFGHAGARSGSKHVSAEAKNKALADAGAHVPESFNDFGLLINKVFKEFVETNKSYEKPDDENYNIPPLDMREALKRNLVRKESSIVSSISDDRGEEPTYNGKEITEYIEKPLGSIINALWFKGGLNMIGEEFLELCLKITADHGPAVATAHNAIVTSRANRDIATSTAAGILTIGDRHGGAIDGAARWAFDCVSNRVTARSFVQEMKEKKELIMGIGHKIKSAQNPDKRVEVLKKFAETKGIAGSYLKFALEVEQETLKKKNNLILNVDGAIGVIFLDILAKSGKRPYEIEEILKVGSLNGIFILGRTIGMIGHAIDQKRMNEGIYRHPWDDIQYIS